MYWLQFRRFLWRGDFTLEEVDPTIEILHETVDSILILANTLEFESLFGYHAPTLPVSVAWELIDKRTGLIERINGRAEHTPHGGW
jgi:hypothetical protein